MRNPEAIEHGGKPGFYYGSVPLYDNEKQITYRVTVTCQGYEDRIHFLTITRGTPTTPSQSQSQKYYLTNTSIQLYYSHNRLDPAAGLRRKEKQNLRKPSERSSEGFFCQAVLGGLMEKLTVPAIRQRKGGEKITMLTAYDYVFGGIVDDAGIDIILVGDSLGNVMLGYPNTLPVTVDEMIHHTKAVVKATKRALVVIDMPFMSYQESIEQARRNAGRMIKESGAEVVKVEGGLRMKDVIRAMVDIEIPVMAHIGLTPQSVHRMGGYKVQGKGAAEEMLFEDARAVEEAGAFSVVLEGVPRNAAKKITEMLTIPTIGIGAGPDCDGQVLVLHDLLGLLGQFRPKFVKSYVNIRAEAEKGIKQYIEEVKSGAFPDDTHSFH
jgi:3-methyl-2-oxobutanoate hydroxymethyltransferase